MDNEIENMRMMLEEAGAMDIPVYIKRLRNNVKDIDTFQDFYCEGRVALMFLKHNFLVTMREKPDLRININHEQFYAEVKHFRLKKQDIIDDAKMLEAKDELVEYGNTVPLEIDPAWLQVAKVAKAKKDQYQDGAPNILVIWSDSHNCVEDIEIETAVNDIDKEVYANKIQGLKKLNGILLIQKCFNFRKQRNVYFFPVKNPFVALNTELLIAINAITIW